MGTKIVVVHGLATTTEEAELFAADVADVLKLPPEQVHAFTWGSWDSPSLDLLRLARPEKSYATVQALAQCLAEHRPRLVLAHSYGTVIASRLPRAVREHFTVNIGSPLTHPVLSLGLPGEHVPPSLSVAGTRDPVAQLFGRTKGDVVWADNVTHATKKYLASKIVITNIKRFL